MKRYQHQAFAIAALSLGLLLAAPVRAGTYGKIDQATWSAGVTGLPSYVNMYSYVPSTVASKPPIVVYAHHCQGMRQLKSQLDGSLESIADKNGFIIIYPEATGRELLGCRVGQIPQTRRWRRHSRHRSDGEVHPRQVQRRRRPGVRGGRLLGRNHDRGAARRVPDVFMAGVSIMGVPCGCWADGYNDVTGSLPGGTAQWSGSCAGGTVTKTGAQWGDLVRSYFPSYTGHRPRLQQWHGATDTTLNFKNVAEDIKEWTNLLALSETPTGTEQNTPKSGTTHQFWKNSCYTVYETFVLANTGHAVSLDGPTLAAYFGIDKAGGQDPETAACPGAVPGGGSSGGAGGSPGSGGSTGAGGAAGASGSKDGGLGGRDGGGSGSGGAQGTGGAPGNGGTQGTGGAPGNGGTQGTGGSAGSGGVQGSGGVPGSGGSTAKGGTNGGFGGSASGSGGITGNGGSVAQAVRLQVVATWEAAAARAQGAHIRPVERVDKVAIPEAERVPSTPPRVVAAARSEADIPILIGSAAASRGLRAHHPLQTTGASLTEVAPDLRTRTSRFSGWP
jgi:acetylxylan esterase